MFTFNGTWSYADLNDLVTDLLAGRSISDTLFRKLLNKAKDHYEAKRNWRVLVKLDTSKTWTSADTFQTAKALPSDFRKTLKNNTMKLTIAGQAGSKPMIEIPMEQQFEYQSQFGYFFIDHANGNYYLCGSTTQQYTINFFYIKRSPDITASAPWVFPNEYHPLLAFRVAMTQKGGIDYDDINSRMNQSHGIDVAETEGDMDFWDASLWQSALNA